MEGNKYYTPEPEELYIGYSCEIKNTADAQLRFFPATITKEFIGTVVKISKEGIRTKYLDQFDIESLGWVFDANKEDDYKFYLNGFILYFPYAEEEPLLITHRKDTVYLGPCKSINELRTIMKFLNIK